MPIVTPKKVNIAPIDAKSFSVADLQIATDSFNVENLIGEGSIGRVFRAQLDDGKVCFTDYWCLHLRTVKPILTVKTNYFMFWWQVVAVKKINASVLSNSDDFLAIVSEISQLHHPNIVELIGYCCEHGQHLLVYEFHKNGSLHEFLYLSDEYTKPLTWNSRVKIALGTARALEYVSEARFLYTSYWSFQIFSNILWFIWSCAAGTYMKYVHPLWFIRTLNQLTFYSTTSSILIFQTVR